MKFYLVRHCSASWKKTWISKFSNVPLSEEGKEEAKEVSNHLKNLEF